MKKRFNSVMAFTAALVLGITAVLGSGVNITYTAAAAYSFEGSGTEEDPFLIGNADDMAALEAEVNSGKTYSGCYFELTADITLPDDWIAIGDSSSSRFCGIFDGAGHTITFPEGYTTDGSCAGVFGFAGTYTTPAEIKNLTVDGELTATNNIYAGAVVGFFVGNLENCISNVSINITQYDKGSNDTFCAGGVAGVFSGGTMSGCINNGEVTYSIISSVVVDGRNGDYRLVAVGGLLGREIYRSSSPSKIVNCINTGDVIIASCNESFDSISEPSGIFFSCLVGYGLGSSTIAACVNTGSVYLSSAVTTPEINVGSVDISVAAINGYKASLTTTCCYTTFDVNESYGEYNTEGDAVTYVETFDMETIWILNTLNGEEENSMFWTLDDENMATPATEESPAVVRVLFQFADGTEEAVYVKAGSTAQLPDGCSETSFTGFSPGLTVVTEDITVVEYTGESDHSAAGHSYDSGAVTKEATCTEDGVITYTCTVCGDSYTETVAATGHSYTSKVTKAATCTAAGVRTYTCSKCGDTYTETIAKISHSYSGNVCTVCGTLKNSKISSATVTLSKTSYTYSGSEKSPSVTVKINGTTLTKNTDYTVSYSNNTNAGTATVTITGKGSYSGTATAEFTIKAKSISSAEITLSSTSYTYDGSVKKPSVESVTVDDTTLSDSDYTVKYASGRKSIGTYKVKVTGTGNYTGTATVTFTIKPAKVTISGAASSAAKKLTVKWSKVSGSVTGYQVRYKKSTSSSWTTVTVKASTLSKTLSSLTAGKIYNVQVRAYKTVSGTKYYGSWSSTKTVTVKKAQTLTVKASSSKTVSYSKVKSAKQTISFITKVSGAKGTVTYSKSSGKSYFTVNSKTGKITVKKGTPKGTYTVKIKVTSAATSTYASASKTITVKIKVK